MSTPVAPLMQRPAWTLLQAPMGQAYAGAPHTPNLRPLFWHWTELGQLHRYCNRTHSTHAYTYIQRVFSSSMRFNINTYGMRLERMLRALS